MERFEVPRADYESDFVQWLQGQIHLLREREFARLDVDNLLEELEGILRREHRELRHRLEILLLHLLKCQCQPERSSGSWRGSVLEQRSAIRLLLEDSPSLKRHVQQYADTAYPRAVRAAAQETGLPIGNFPSSSPFTVEQILNADAFP